MMPVQGGSTEQRLLSVAQAVAAAAGFGFAPGCAADLESTLRNAVQRMASEGRSDDVASVDLAERNTRALVQQMVAEAQMLGLSELHENTLAAALSALCPIWPIC